MTLSPFVKKLMFARQFDIDKGSVTFLKQREVIVSPKLFSLLDKKKMVGISQTIFEEEINNIKKSTGLSKLKLVELFLDLLDSFGFGKFKLHKLEPNVIVQVFGLPKDSESYVQGALIGGFNVVFDKKFKIVSKKLSGGYEFVLS